MNSTTNPEQVADFQHLIAVETAVKQVRNALLITRITGIILVFFAFLSAIVFQTSPLQAWWILEILFVFGMSYGISRYSTVCMSLMFGYLVLSGVLGLFTGGLSTYGFFCKISVLHYIWIGIDATKRYNLLMRKERSLRIDVDTTMDRDRPPYSQLAAGDDIQKISAPSQPLNPIPELVSLCGGDRAQAQWLLSKVKSKHPDRSVAWCNQQVIEQLTA
jgi:hypothetical protein